jgi:hypothetical protein
MKSELIALWEERFKQKESSGLTVNEWCEKNQVAKPTYYYWKSRIKNLSADEVQSNTFVEIFPAVQEQPTEATLRIVWNNLSLFLSTKPDALLAAEFINQLQRLC